MFICRSTTLVIKISNQTSISPCVTCYIIIIYLLVYFPPSLPVKSQNPLLPHEREPLVTNYVQSFCFLICTVYSRLGRLCSVFLVHHQFAQRQYPKLHKPECNINLRLYKLKKLAEIESTMKICCW